MASVPSAVITGTFLNDQGNPVAGLPVNFSLETFHPQTGPWKIANTCILPNPPDTITVNTTSNGSFIVTLWGNDVIEVAGGGSYYQVLAGNFTGSFIFVQGDNYNLLTATPLVPFPNTSPIAPPAGSQAANTVYAGPTGGGAALPSFRDLVAADIPTINISPVENAGVFTNTQQNDIFAVLGNSADPGTWYSDLQAGNFATEGVVGAVQVPASATVHQINGVAGYVYNLCTSTEVYPVALYGQATLAASGSEITAGNLVVADTTGNTGIISGLEVDVSVNNTTTQASAISVQGAWSTQSTNANVFVVGSLNSSYHWTNGIIFEGNATDNDHGSAITLNTSGTGSNLDSQSITFNSSDLTAYLFAQDTSSSLYTNAPLLSNVSVGAPQLIGTSGGTGTAAAVLVKSGVPAVAWDATGQSTDSKLWDIAAGIDSNTLRFRYINDAQNNAPSWLYVTRNATTSVVINIGGNTDVTGAVTASGGFVSGSSSGVSEGPYTSISSITTVGGLVTALSGTSDEKLKDAIPYEGGLDEVLSITPVRYKWNEKGQEHTGFGGNQEFVGFLAQDVQEAIPEAITATEASKDGTETYLSFDDRPIIAALVNAIKELKAEIEALKAKVS